MATSEISPSGAVTRVWVLHIDPPKTFEVHEIPVLLMSRSDSDIDVGSLVVVGTSVAFSAAVENRTSSAKVEGKWDRLHETNKPRIQTEAFIFI